MSVLILFVFAVAQMLLIIARLQEDILWSWWYVMSPTWTFLILVLVVLLVED